MSILLVLGWFALTNPDPGPASERTVRFTVTEGTWMNLDVSPDGQHVVFDFLGDIYTMPIESDAARVPRKLTSGVAWDMQPRFSPNGKWIAFSMYVPKSNKPFASMPRKPKGAIQWKSLTFAEHHPFQPLCTKAFYRVVE